MSERMQTHQCLSDGSNAALHVFTLFPTSSCPVTFICHFFNGKQYKHSANDFQDPDPSHGGNPRHPNSSRTAPPLKMGGLSQKNVKKKVACIVFSEKEASLFVYSSDFRFLSAETSEITIVLKQGKRNGQRT